MNEIDIFRSLEKCAHPKVASEKLTDLRQGIWDEIRRRQGEQARRFSWRVRAFAIACAAAAMVIMSVNLYLFSGTKNEHVSSYPTVQLYSYYSADNLSTKP